VYVPEVTKQLKPTIETSFRDGQSNTIILTEHYALNCNNTQFFWIVTSSPRTFRIENVDYTARRSSFADVGDVVPNPTAPPTLTFQIRPRIADCNPRIPQSPFSGGLLAGMGDGSVKFVSPGVSSATFWGAVTPAGGETLGSDW
jgi:hypothetical protein